MSNLRDVKKRLWLKSAILGASLYGCFALLIYFLRSITQNTTFDPWYFLIAAILFPLSLPLLTKIFSPPRSQTNYEHQALEDKFERYSMDLITNCFGLDIAEKLYLENLNWVVNDGIEQCSKLLTDKKVCENDELKFVFLLKLSAFFFKDGQYNRAIEILEEALQIKPNNAVANLRVAEIYERIGAGDDAIAHYERVSSNSSELSDKLVEHICVQIKRIKSEGPSKKQPPSGAKWMTG